VQTRSWEAVAFAERYVPRGHVADTLVEQRDTVLAVLKVVELGW
jgi:hypothetical protein